MHDLSSQRTRKFVIASIVWVGLSLLLADTYGEWGFFTEDFDLTDIMWDIFIFFISPVVIYWAYHWVKKGR